MAQVESAATLERALTAWNAGDLESYLELLYADDIRLHGYSPQPMDMRGLRAFYDGFFTAFPGSWLTFHETLWDGDRVCIRFSLSGKHLGPFLGVAPTGRDITFEGITVLHFRDGKCHERWASADMLGLLVQIGAVPPLEELAAPSVEAPSAH